MVGDREDTIKHRPAISVVVIGASAELLDATKHAALEAAAARVHSCQLSEAATVAAKHRPFAIVVSEMIYAFGEDELDALARDVGAHLIRVDCEGPDRPDLLRQLIGPLSAASMQVVTIETS